MTELFRYEGDVVDVRARDLPGLKARFLVDHVADGGVVIDIGCGGGKMLQILARERPAAKLYGCDLKPLSEQSSAFEFRLVDDPGRLPFDDQMADTALVIDVLEHITQPQAFIAEVARVLRPGGHLVAFVPTEGQRFSAYRLFRLALGDDLYVKTKDHVQAFRRADIPAMLNPAFEIEQRRYAYHFLGHIMDASFCAMLRVPFVTRLFWNQSPYHNRNRRRSLMGRAFGACLVAANRVAWAESTALARVPLSSAGLLLVARRR
jgi:SAM-dependent methyltransferase